MEVIQLTLTDPHKGRSSSTTSVFNLTEPRAMYSRDVTNPISMRLVVSASRVTLKVGRRAAVQAVIKEIESNFDEALWQHSVWRQEPECAPRVYGYGLVSAEKDDTNAASVGQLSQLFTADMPKSRYAVIIMEYIEHTLVNDLALLAPSDISLLLSNLERAQYTLDAEHQRMQDDAMPRNILMRVDATTRRVSSFVLSDYGRTKAINGNEKRRDDFWSTWSALLMRKLSQFIERWIHARPTNPSLEWGSLLEVLEPLAKQPRSVDDKLWELTEAYEVDTENESESE